MESEYLSWLSINAFQTALKDKSGRVLSDYQYLLTDPKENIASSLTNLRKAVGADGNALYPELKGNPLLRALSIVKPGKGNSFYGLTFNSRNKADATFTEKQTDAFVELLSSEHPEVAAFANKLVLYLAVKDNFKFKNASFIKVMPAIKLTLPSEQLKKVAAAIRGGNQEEVKSLTGYSVEDGFQQFLSHYFSGPMRDYLKPRPYTAKGEEPVFPMYYLQQPNKEDIEGKAEVKQLAANGQYITLPQNFTFEKQSPYHLPIGNGTVAATKVAEQQPAEWEDEVITGDGEVPALQIAMTGGTTEEEKRLLDSWEADTKPEMHSVSLSDKLFFIRQKLAGKIIENCYL